MGTKSSFNFLFLSRGQQHRPVTTQKSARLLLCAVSHTSRHAIPGQEADKDSREESGNAPRPRDSQLKKDEAHLDREDQLSKNELTSDLGQL